MRKIIATIIVMATMMASVMAGTYKYNGNKYEVNRKTGVVKFNGQKVEGEAIADFAEAMAAMMGDSMQKNAAKIMQKDLTAAKKHFELTRDALYACSIWVTYEFSVGHTTAEEMSAQLNMIGTLLAQTDYQEAQLKAASK